MSSFLYDLVRDHQSELIGFGQAFLISGILVGLGYWIKARLLGRSGAPAANRSRSSKPAKRKQQGSAKRRPTYVEASTAVEAVPAAEVSEDATSIVPTQPLSLEAHSQLVTEHMRMTIARGERIVALHSRARIRLESADYAFQRLVMDLAHLISVPKKPELIYPVPIGNALKHATRLAA